VKDSRHPALAAAPDILGSAPVANALAISSIGCAVLAFLLQRTIGWPGLLGALVVLVLLTSGSLFARRESLEWHGLLPVSLLVFLGWAATSLLWSQYQWATLGGLAYLGAFTLLGLYVALTRDTIHIVRAFGAVLRVTLAASVAVEIIAGLLLDSRIGFLDVAGDLGVLGPIQGVMGSRNQLGLLAVIAVVTFGTELRTRSVPRAVGIGSLALAGACLVLSRSPIVAAVLIVVLIAAAALYGLRRVAPERRTFWQLALLFAVAVLALVVWLARSRVIELLNAGGALNYRLEVWRRIWGFIASHNLEGWGWVGLWRPDVQPFPAFANSDGSIPSSALNAFLDVWFQLGLVGVVIFTGLVGLAFVRSWLLAGRRRSFVFAWPALILVALVTISLAESTILLQYGWLTLVICCVKAARELSWRTAFEPPLAPTALD
jgi:O-antigen ligase